MLLLLTIALVVVGAVSLLIGFVNDQMFPIYLSIGCSIFAAVVLLVFSRLSRTRLEPAARPASSGTAAAPVRTPAAATSASSFSPSGDDGLFPIAEYDDLRVSEILPLLPELDLDELEMVREREEGGRARASILRRLDELADELEEPAVAAAPVSASRDDDDLFPIEDYDDLRVGEILPLLDELEPDELEDVAARERSGAARASILDRINARLGIEEPAIAAPRAGTATKKAAAKKTTKKAPAKKSGAAAKAPAKTAAKKATTGTAKTAGAAKKATGGGAKKAGGTKKAAKKATGTTKR